MNTFEKLLDTAENRNIPVYENIELSDRLKGLYVDGHIAMSTKLTKSDEKACILAEELGHHFVGCGNILDLKNLGNLKQEHKARVWAYKYLCPVENIIFALQDGYRTTWDMADYLSVDEAFLIECLKYYKIL